MAAKNTSIKKVTLYQDFDCLQSGTFSLHVSNISVEIQLHALVHRVSTNGKFTSRSQNCKDSYFSSLEEEISQSSRVSQIFCIFPFNATRL